MPTDPKLPQDSPSPNASRLAVLDELAEGQEQDFGVDPLLALSKKFRSELFAYTLSDWAFSLESPVLSNQRSRLRNNYQSLAEDLRRQGANAKPAQQLANLLRMPLLAQDLDKVRITLRRAPEALAGLLRTLEEACPSSNVSTIRSAVDHLVEATHSLSHRTAADLLRRIDHILGSAMGDAPAGRSTPAAAYALLLSLLPPHSFTNRCMRIHPSMGRPIACGIESLASPSSEDVEAQAMWSILAAVRGGHPLPSLDPSRRAVEASLRAMIDSSPPMHREASTRHREAFDQNARHHQAHTLLEDLHRVQAHLFGESQHHEALSREKRIVSCDSASFQRDKWHKARANRYRTEACTNLEMLRYILLYGTHPTEDPSSKDEATAIWVMDHGDLIRRSLQLHTPSVDVDPRLGYDPTCVASAHERSRSPKHPGSADAHLHTFTAAQAMRDLARALALGSDMVGVIRNRAVHANEYAASEHRQAIATSDSELLRAEHAAFAEYHDQAARLLIAEASNCA